MAKKRTDDLQLGFGDMLAAADNANHDVQREREHAHLPGTMPEGIAYFRDLIAKHHAAMLAADEAMVASLRKEARRLALKLNGFNAGTHADQDSPGYVLDRSCRAPHGAVPLWGQEGEFIIVAAGAKVLVELGGMLNLFATGSFWLSFYAHAVDWHAPFISNTGYRSFLCPHCTIAEGIQPDTFARLTIESYMAQEMKKGLVSIEAGYRERHMAREQAA